MMHGRTINWSARAARRIVGAMQIVICCLVGLALASCGSGAGAPPARPAPAGTPSPELMAMMTDMHGRGSVPVEPFRVVGNIYYVGAAGVASYLIVTPDGNILLDTGTREMIPLVPASIAKLGFKLGDIKVLLSGHAHWDHVQGHAAIQRATGAKVMAMAGDAETLESGADVDGVEHWDPVHVDRVLHDGDTVTLGGTTLRAVWAPGHTPGCTIWTTTVIDQARPYSLAFYACAGPAAEVQLIDNPTLPNLVEQSLATFHHLKQLTPDIYLMMHAWDQFVRNPARLATGATPHPLYDPHAWIQVLDEDEADLRQRIAAERARRAAPPSGAAAK